MRAPTPAGARESRGTGVTPLSRQQRIREPGIADQPARADPRSPGYRDPAAREYREPRNGEPRMQRRTARRARAKRRSSARRRRARRNATRRRATCSAKCPSACSPKRYRVRAATRRPRRPVNPRPDGGGFVAPDRGTREPCDPPRPRAASDMSQERGAQRSQLRRRLSHAGIVVITGIVEARGRSRLRRDPTLRAFSPSPCAAGRRRSAPGAGSTAPRAPRCSSCGSAASRNPRCPRHPSTRG
jgi:hypothetical protein